MQQGTLIAAALMIAGCAHAHNISDGSESNAQGALVALALQALVERFDEPVRVDPRPIATTAPSHFPTEADLLADPGDMEAARRELLGRLGLEARHAFPRLQCSGRYLPEHLKEVSGCPEAPFTQLIMGTPRPLENGGPAGAMAIRFFSTYYLPDGATSMTGDVILRRTPEGNWKVLRVVPLVAFD